MALQLVQYMDLRLTIDNRPPTYEYIEYQPQGGPITEITRDDDGEEDGFRQESRPGTKDTKSSRQSTGSKSGARSQPTKSPSRQSLKAESKSSGRSKDFADVAVQDEGGDPHTAMVDEIRTAKSSSRSRMSQKLEPVDEFEASEFEDAFDLADHAAWSSVPGDQMPSRFSQYRRLSQRKMHHLEEQLELTRVKTQRKVQTLKAQFQEHKSKWEQERKVLIEQVEQAQKLQNEAEKEADTAMSQLEEFINEQEKLENEEEAKRASITGFRRPVRTRKPRSPTPGKTEEVADVPQVQTEDTEHELRNLMQQTDDAKAQSRHSRHSRITSGAMSAPPAVEPDDASGSKKTPAEPGIIAGNTEEDIRATSAISRASLRSQYKSRLDEVRHAVEDRRSKSPAIEIPTPKSLEDDQLVLEDDDDDDMPVTDEVKEEMSVATSPPPSMAKGSASTHRLGTRGSKRSVTLADHPVVHQYLKTYDGVLSFKNEINQIMSDKDLISASEMLANLQTYNFDKESKVQPQLDNMTQNVYQILNEISNVIGSILLNDRDPAVSSLHVSREATQKTLEKMSDSGRGPTVTQSHSFTPHSKSASSEKLGISELTDRYERMQQQLDEETRKHEEQLRHNTVVMMEMQDTINELQRELSALGRGSRRAPSEAGSTQQQPESAVMFTRLDLDRNAKIMKKAVMDDKLHPERYKEAVSQMDDYVGLPSQRLAHLVRKYVHHCQMKEIEENVKKSRSLNENVFEILDKMEALQNQRAKKWADRMDEMGLERLRLANLLMETLDTIEQESGIFLIKPMYSYRGREPRERYTGKLSRPYRPPRTVSPVRNTESAYAPAPTPASNIRGIMRQDAKPTQQTAPMEGGTVREETVRPLEGDDSGVTGASVNWVGVQPSTTWSFTASQAKPDDSSLPHTNYFNTPRILELDINRMLIGQNTISAKLHTGLSDDRLVNASQNNLRSYVTVNRPTANPGQGRTDRPRSHSGSGSNVPPGTPSTQMPLSAGQKRVRVTDAEFSRAIPSTPPLPPISRGRQSPVSSPREPPRSPPGSSMRHSPPQSMRHSPPQVLELISPMK